MCIYTLLEDTDIDYVCVCVCVCVYLYLLLVLFLWRTLIGTPQEYFKGQFLLLSANTI